MRSLEHNELKPPFFKALDLLCQLLRQHISEAKKDLVKSSMSSPVYGIIQSIRAAYECVGAVTFAHDSRYHREAMVTVISICDDIARLVSPVVCSSSPEGFLPEAEGEPYLEEDQSSSGNAQSGSAESAQGEGAQSATHTHENATSERRKDYSLEFLGSSQSVPQRSQGNAQSLLLCCWHSMKEIALLLGYLTEYAPVVSDSTSTDQKGVITHGQVSVM